MTSSATPAPPVDGPPSAGPSTAGRRAFREAERVGHRKRRGAAAVTRIGVLLIGLVLLWPAAWGGFSGLTVVQGHSMMPTYVTGDLVVTWRQADYGIGDVISYVVPEGQNGAGGRVIHRIVSIDATGDAAVFTTQGDNNAEPDVWRITSADVTGKAIWKVPGLGTLLGGQTYPLIVGAAAGFIVIILIWPRTSETRRARGQGEPSAAE